MRQFDLNCLLYKGCASMEEV